MIYSLFLILVLLLGCSPTESEEPEYGCTIQSACNFESDATTYDASCLWPLNAGCSCSDVENEVDGCNSYFSLDPSNLIDLENVVDPISDSDDNSEDFEFNDISICSEVGYDSDECDFIDYQCSEYLSFEAADFDFDESDIEFDFPICCCLD